MGEPAHDMADRTEALRLERVRRRSAYLRLTRDEIAAEGLLSGFEAPRVVQSPEAAGSAGDGRFAAGLRPHPSRWRRLIRHRWHEDAAQGLLGSAGMARLEQSVADSEHFHSGEIRVCLEGGLPWSYLWRRASARERALALFGKLGVWDTEHNNGVLIYLLVADRAIEIVTDRGLTRRVGAHHWGAVLDRLSPDLKAGRFAEGLAGAIHAVDALLQAHFPLEPGGGAARNPDELPNRPVIL